MKFYIPILWRFLITHFLKIAIACVLAFVAILLTMQLDEIAHFAALGAPPHYLLYFTLHQIPYILPIALPISCLIGSLLLIQKLSGSHELTALRASGFSLSDIFAPIFLTAAFLSLANFWVASELATQSHLQTNLLKSELRSINPLLLLHNKHLMRLKGFYFEALGSSQVGESASDVVFALPNKHQKRIHLMLAKNLKTSPAFFLGQNVAIITTAPGEKENDFDHMLLENMGASITQIQDFADLLQKKVLTVNNDYLKLPLLLIRIQDQRRQLKEAKIVGNEESQIHLKMELNRSLGEITKRFSLSLAVFSFTLMGASFGLHIGRKKKIYTLFFAILLTTVYLISFFVAKGLHKPLWITGSFYLIPHLLIIIASLIALKRISKGVE